MRKECIDNFRRTCIYQRQGGGGQGGGWQGGGGQGVEGKGVEGKRKQRITYQIRLSK